MRPRIGQQHRIAVTEQQLRIAQHPRPVIGVPVQEYDGVAVALQGPDAPAAQCNSVAGNNSDLGQLRVVALCNGMCLRF